MKHLIEQIILIDMTHVVVIIVVIIIISYLIDSHNKNQKITLTTSKVISDELLQEVMLPGLHYLHNDLQQVAPEMVNVVTSMIRDFEDKVESGKLVDR